MAKYNTYIELSPHYESVVDIDSETRHPEMWQEYIVHEDMKGAIEVICDSLKYEQLESRKSFWIHGAYGTGKSYAAIVLKHLFEDDVPSIRKFLSNQMLIPYRERFISIREKGEFLVIWKSQATDIKSGIQLMMTMEDAIREKLKEKFGTKAYYGKNSLIAAARDAVNDKSINWDELFMNQSYALYEEYGSVDEFRDEVANGSLKAANVVARIYRDKGWGFFTSLQMFKDWVSDVIEGNHLQDTGIIFIWDEFTSYLRNNPTDDILQPLSEFCKEQPFFMFLIVHRAPSWVSQIGEEVYDRIVHRFHSLDFHVSESAAYELIGSSILTRAGMDDQWNAEKDKLMKSISKNFADFDNLDMSNKKERLRQLCPLHPMTLSLLAIVAQNFGASQRTLFRFMKDSKESEKNVGFIYYINNFGPDDWRWLTPDFLWDYFFTRESDVRSFSTEAKSAYQHYMTKREFISDDYHMHVFKAAMLLIAVMSSGTVSNLYSQATQRKVSATSSTLYKCFAGQLTKEDVEGYLTDLEQIGVLRLDAMTNGDKRLQIPYSGNADVFDVRKEMLMKVYTRYELFKKNGIFAKSMESKIWDKNSASYGRMYIAACDAGTTSINARFNEVQAELKKSSYKFGILAIAISESSQFAAMQDKVKTLAAQDTTGRMAIYLIKSPLTDEDLDRWYNAMTHSELAAEEGKSGDADKYSDEASTIVEEWSGTAKDDQLMAVCGEKVYPSEYGTEYFAPKLERDILFGSVFTAAPELVVTTNTAFKKIQQSTSLAGVQKTTPNTQVGSIVNGLKIVGVWDTEGLSNLAQATGSNGADAIGKVANYLLQRFSQGTQIKLDALWQELQEAPYGYYNNMTCGYILGFLLREYVNSEFSWNRGDNNPWPLTEQTLATMITALCKEEVVNNYLSPGSEIWQKFKPYVQRVFKLQDGEAVNETEARKYMSKQCTESAGAPFWVLKYVSEDKFGGMAAKQTADEIIDLFCDFMAENGDQEQVMGNITVKFTGHGTVRKALTNLYFDQNTVYDAFSAFITQKSPELQKLRDSIGLTSHDLFDAIHQMMQGQVSTWTEAQVEEKLAELCVEYQAVAILNTALNQKRKSIKALSDDIKNAFDHMKVPGSVVEKLDFSWIPAMKAMYEISTTQWSKIDLADRKSCVERLNDDVQKAWSSLTSPKVILRHYMEKRGDNCTEEELDDIYAALKAVSYNSPVSDFDTRIETQLNKVNYNRNKVRIQELWKAQSGFDTVTKWCDNYAVPIQWVVSDEVLPHISVLKTVQDGKLADNTTLHNATQYFENHKISALRDKKLIMDSFIGQIGESYRAAFEASGAVLISRMKTNANLTSDVYSWANKVGTIRKTIDTFLRDKYCGEAKENVRTMSESKLRDTVVQLLDENPDLYTLFIKK
ncbi:MAG: hypothetical protein IKO03_03350 [Lachnospiraceae bacterium]|nr:hypothetical protein [Lachnospiraceae bacterium]